MPTAYHVVHYRRLDFGADWDGKTLEGLCRQSLDAESASKIALWERAQDRIFEVRNENDRQILLNKVADLSSAVFGELCLIQRQDLQTLIELKTSKVQLSDKTMAEIFNLGERAAPAGSQFVRGMLYWMTIGNHVFFVKTHSMTPSYLHEYLSWLLSERTSTIDRATTFTLRAELDRAQVTDDIGEIRSLRLSGKSAPQIAMFPISDESEGRVIRTARTVADRFVDFAQALPVVEALFGKTRTDSLVNSLGKDEYLSVDATVKVRGRRTAESRARLREIVNDVADMTEAKVQVVGKDGTISEGDAILRTRMPFDLPYEGSNLLEFDNVADQLQEVYTRFVKDGKIAA
jgi:hypothetical protein